MNEKKMIWNVYRHDFNSKEIDMFNVFDNGRFYEYVRKLLKTKNITREEFEEQLRKDAMYCFWCKCEYEVIVTSFPPYVSKEEIDRLVSKDVKYRTYTNLETGKKVDIYQQLQLNWDAFVSYVWSFR